jgi:NADH:ubiquinone oxidoreductase subunit 5 (subunit L)/multisubunit Na+/H+ antiporter MnhA subunit
MSFFSFSMLLLLFSSNFLAMFAGWELVGLASVLLINFWFNRQEANWGALKAFSFNRIGDAAILFSMMIFFFYCGSLNFDTIEIFVFSPQSNQQLFFVGFCFMFIGAFAKSAQFFFHSWLPDAMEGPTPVSALLHSATMVTAGVYLAVRFWFVLVNFPVFQTLIMLFGLCTSFYSAIVLTTVNNAKHTTAYTTLNQLGFMFYSAGALCFATTLFHLFVHGFYKSFTFLENAIELASLEDEQDAAVGFFNTSYFESFMDIFGFIVFISVNALPFSSPSVSKELLVFTGLESFSTFVSFFLLSTLFIGFMDSCYDDFSGDNSVFQSFGALGFLISPFPIVFAYFTLGIAAFVVVFMCEELFLTISIVFGDFYVFNLFSNGSFFLFIPFIFIIVSSIFFPARALFSSSNHSFKLFLSNLFFYDTSLVNLLVTSFFKFFYNVYVQFDRGVLEKLFIFYPLQLFPLTQFYTARSLQAFFPAYISSFMFLFFLIFLIVA